MSSQAHINQPPASHPAEAVKQTIGQPGSHEENASSHHIQTQENALLNEVITTVGSTLKLDEVLRHIVDITVRATLCHAAFIYLYDRKRERLVLASTNEWYHHHVGKISMALGEGIVGWVAQHQKPVFLKEEAMGDPRFYYFPELEEEKFQSVMTVPIITKERHLIGVITLHATAPHEFTERHHTFLNNTASLVGGAIENAQLYENMQRKFNVFSSLSTLSQTISSGLYLDDMLRSLATLIVQIMEVDLCVIKLAEQTYQREKNFLPPAKRLTIHATAPASGNRSSSFPYDGTERAQETRRERIPATDEQAARNDDSLERLNHFQNTHYKSLVAAPLIAGTEELGIINCYSSKTRNFAAEDKTLLTTIANFSAIAIKNSYLTSQLAQKDLVKAFFDDLIHDGAVSEEALKQRANFLGCDLSRAHVVIMCEITQIDEEIDEGSTSSKTSRGERHTLLASMEDESSPQRSSQQALYKRICGTLRRRIQDTFSGSICHEHENLLTCLISLSKDHPSTRLKTWLQDMSHQIFIEYHAHLSIGIGNPCQQIREYRRGFAEASEALHLGQDFHRDKGNETKFRPIITHFNDLGAYRYLYKIAHMDDLRDIYQDQIAHIDHYDRRKKTDLLDTLETYLEYAGNLTKTSEHLFVHRNTLIQRLDRLQSLCSIDLQERSNWLALQLAIKVFKLRSRNA